MLKNPQEVKNARIISEFNRSRRDHPAADRSGLFLRTARLVHGSGKIIPEQVHNDDSRPVHVHLRAALAPYKRHDLRSRPNAPCPLDSYINNICFVIYSGKSPEAAEEKHGSLHDDGLAFEYALYRISDVH